ncbi:intradiol ring-cleavage dioxygenase [Streptomyces litchfieldiae]|uniref:Intradiol ring-cleavage dioxygenase n=1 Tax=Streptomyces litchfieldiae TaxID=3075543 RepID=A0ABU2MX60_9ACTN|nr:intradiol ring-cleavage dioxygenase [Streptomyces sp. DSM 44938]MDT0346241.1 intradiol ring-cleavage dioxygenase [Streptomyces sp. DSM 44938]
MSTNETPCEFSRRRMLALSGAGVAGLALAACDSSAPAGSGAESTGEAAATEGGATTSAQCVLTTNLTEGPYYLDGAMIRADITDGKTGVPLTLRLTVQDTTEACAPVPGAAVEIWHCDAWGYYSGYTENSPGGEVPAESEDGSGADPETFLRGFQVAGEDGTVEFTTIVPGWYSGRTTHIHVKVHTGGEREDGGYEGGTVNFTGQLFFADDIVTSVNQSEPYSRHTGDGPMTLDEDSIYQGGGTADGLLAMEKSGDGYLGTLILGIDPDAENDGGGGAGGGEEPPAPPQS